MNWVLTIWSVRRVRWWRAQIAAERCDVRPGIRHAWTPEMTVEARRDHGLQWFECSKCGYERVS